jgi:hypothetical protein
MDPQAGKEFCPVGSNPFKILHRLQQNLDGLLFRSLHILTVYRPSRRRPSPLQKGHLQQKLYVKATTGVPSGNLNFTEDDPTFVVATPSERSINPHK